MHLNSLLCRMVRYTHGQVFLTNHEQYRFVRVRGIALCFEGPALPSGLTLSCVFGRHRNSSVAVMFCCSERIILQFSSSTPAMATRQSILTHGYGHTVEKTRPSPVNGFEPLLGSSVLRPWCPITVSCVEIAGLCLSAHPQA